MELNGTSAGAESDGLKLSGDGLKISGGSSMITGLVINRFFGCEGITLQTNGNNTIQNCFIGTDSGGTLDQGNTGHGVLIFSSASNNTIGGTTAGTRNVISGNNGDGVAISRSGSTMNQVQGNFIGTNAAGTTALPNGTDGVVIDAGASSNTIGGTGVGAGNVISGNPRSGVEINGSGSTMNQVRGNFIGTNSAGTGGLGNSSDGVIIIAGATSNTIGGTAAGARNIISGNNGGSGVVIFGSGTMNQVQGNFIGTDVNGTSSIGNGNGVTMRTAASSNTIGGTVAGARNVISGNSIGVDLQDAGTTGNQVQGNFIGTKVDGTSALMNTFSGVFIVAGASSSTIGGTTSGTGNTVAFNGGVGVLVYSSAGTGNAIRQNSIHDNVGLGIDLKFDGVTPNDHCDGDAGPNNLQNFPVLTSAISSGGSTTIQGTLDSTANTTFTLEFFANTAADPSCFGEGQTFIGSRTVTTGSNCIADFTGSNAITVPVTVFIGQVITATATDPSGNTSEFSGGCVGVTPPSCTITCLPDQTVNTGPGSTQCGAPVNYPTPTTTSGCGTVTCTPPSGSFFPVGTTTVTCTTTAGPSCSFKVTVVDNTPPAITCPPPVTTNTDPGQCYASNVNLGTPTTSDNCGVQSVTNNAPSQYPKGTTTVTWTVTDTSGNTATCPQTVTVVDNEKPKIMCPPDMKVFQDSAFGATVNYTVTATDNCQVATVICVPPSGSVFPLGTTTVTCTATDTSGNSASCSFKVTVVPPPSTSGAKVTGGGTIPLTTGGKGTFGLVGIGVNNAGQPQGNVEYQDHDTGMNVNSAVITAVVVTGTHARIFGKATITGSGSFDFVVDVDDLGEPGANVDKFRIQLSNGYTAGGTLDGGNIQIH